MKKIIAILLTAPMILSLTACGSKEKTLPEQGVIERPKQSEITDFAVSTQPVGDTDITVSDETENTEVSTSSNILIAYFTVPETDGVDTVANASRVSTDDGVVGNTEFIAMEIQKNLGGDLFAIETVQEYPGSHDSLLDFAYNEKSDDARPELSTHIESLDGYDYIFVGFPNWNADLPMPLYTFFEENDFSGKIIIPFVTHGGSSFSGTIDTIQELEPNATVIEAGLSISRNHVANAQADVKEWTDALIAE